MDENKQPTKVKCGEIIFQKNKSELAFYCAYCYEESKHLESFLLHSLLFHINSMKNDVNTLVNIVYSTPEINDKSDEMVSINYVSERGLSSVVSSNTCLETIPLKSKCGEIVLKRDKLVLSFDCAYCDQECNKLESFLLHTLFSHINVTEKEFYRLIKFVLNEEDSEYSLSEPDMNVYETDYSEDDKLMANVAEEKCIEIQSNLYIEQNNKFDVPEYNTKCSNTTTAVYYEKFGTQEETGHSAENNKDKNAYQEQNIPADYNMITTTTETPASQEQSVTSAGTILQTCIDQVLLNSLTTTEKTDFHELTDLSTVTTRRISNEYGLLSSKENYTITIDSSSDEHLVIHIENAGNTNEKEVCASAENSGITTQTVCKDCGLKCATTSDDLLCANCSLNNLSHSFKPKSYSCSEERPYKCEKCGRGYKTNRNLIIHQKTHFEGSRYNCQICGKDFKTKITLEKHRLTHLVNRKRYHCDICGATYTESHKLTLHRSRHDGIKPFKCEFCGKGFVTKHELNAHLPKHTGERRYQCKTCGKSFKTTSSLCIHYRKHKNENKYQCDVCGKRMNTSTGLNAHKESHTNDRPYSCDECGVTYKRKNALQSHIDLKHTDVKPFECHICSKLFAKSTLLKYHINAHKKTFKNVTTEHLKKNYKFL